MKKILAFSGSNSSKSINQALINMVADKITQHQVKVIDIRDYAMPIYCIDDEEAGRYPDNAHRLKTLFIKHDAFIISSPEYNGSMPAAFKNTIDWLSRIKTLGQESIFGDKKPMLLLSTSPGPTGGATNLQNLSKLMPWWGADVKLTYSLGSFHTQVNEGKLNIEKDNEINQLVEQFCAQLQAR